MHTKKIVSVSAIVAVYLVLPFFLPAPGFIFKKLWVILFFAAAGLEVFVSGRENLRRLRGISREADTLQERSNVTQDLIRHAQLTRRAFKEKITRYSSLKTIIEQVNENLTLDEIAQKLSNICFSLIGRSRGVCILYLVDDQTRGLGVFAAHKQEGGPVIKAKQGDIFDFWVYRHAQPLMIEDTAKDFRFDQEKAQAEDSRPVGSLISAPLVAGSDFLGVLRLDHPDIGFYSQEDFRFLVTLSDMGAVALGNAKLYEHTQDLAIHDGLTGLFTKGHFFQLLEAECANSLRRARNFCVLMIDIDYFKQYNDTFGHAAGDMVLKALSETLLRFSTDNSAVVCRFGGEEFCVILPLKDKEQGRALAEELRQSVSRISVSLRRQETTVTVSIGLCAFPVDGTDAQELVKKSDKAMYEAKRAGRNRVICA